MSTTPHETPDSENTQDEASGDPAQIEADIARHRAELGETVDELTERLDVKKQAQHKIEAVKKQATNKVEWAQTRANAGVGEVKARLNSEDHRDVLSVLAPALGAVAAVVLIIGVARRARR
ncbi:DUF3618 domain-containing protein [Serinicoccus kebangsaanensis]|uniref:DUF3618 domain-containing protein n=1 Tax=Serinicoccus kebangsaanensis TaxID=2602069 RepID=UPI00124CD248|nr:DUF3618 domain-containing protein [Serinicoccus kebangsaanensis]